MQSAFRFIVRCAPTALLPLCSTTWSLIARHMKSYRFSGSRWPTQPIWPTFSTELNLKISMCSPTQMGQIYLIFNQLPFLWDTSDFFIELPYAWTTTYIWIPQSFRESWQTTNSGPVVWDGCNAVFVGASQTDVDEPYRDIHTRCHIEIQTAQEHWQSVDWCQLCPFV